MHQDTVMKYLKEVSQALRYAECLLVIDRKMPPPPPPHGGGDSHKSRIGVWREGPETPTQFKDEANEN